MENQQTVKSWLHVWLIAQGIRPRDIRDSYLMAQPLLDKLTEAVCQQYNIFFSVWLSPRLSIVLQVLELAVVARRKSTWLA